MIIHELVAKLINFVGSSPAEHPLALIFGCPSSVGMTSVDVIRPHSPQYGEASTQPHIPVRLFALWLVKG